MEADRYQQNKGLFILGLICLLTGISLFLLSLYILPYLLWQWHYKVPAFIIFWQENLRILGYSSKNIIIIMWLSLLGGGLLAGFVSYVSSNIIDDQIYKVKAPIESKSLSDKTIEGLSPGVSFGLKILSLILIVFVTIYIINWWIAF